LSPDADAALAHAGIIRVAGRSRIAGDGTAYPTSTTVWLRADDEQAAISRVRNALAPYRALGEVVTATPVNFLMYLGFLESEAGALEAAADDMRSEDPRVSMVVWREPSDGSAELMLEIPATDQDDAVEQARQLYAELRERAGLPPADALYGFLGRSGPLPPTAPEPPPRHVELAKRAQRLFDDGTYDFAIVAAQTSCEIFAFDAISELLEACEEGVPRRFTSSWFEKSRTHSLAEETLRDLWNALAEDTIQKEPWWESYRQHIVRRHGIVHRGSTPSKDEAEHSLKAAESFRAHLVARLGEARQGSGA
jgi:hypothetical protein